MANKNYDTQCAYDHRGNIVGLLPFGRYEDYSKETVDTSNQKIEDFIEDLELDDCTGSIIKRIAGLKYKVYPLEDMIEAKRCIDILIGRLR